jgi:hypothetical protein
MSDENLPAPPDTDLQFFQAEDGRTKIAVRFEGETVWLTQKLIAELYQITVQTVNEHIRFIYEDHELESAATIRSFRIVQLEGQRQVARNVEHYNLDLILAVGYRVRSARGSQFRRWATEQLKSYIIKGFAIDDERLKSGGTFAGDYFDELLERIRDIRASEKRAYQKLRDIFKLASDYEPNADETIEFFKIMQNKLHWAISGKTAAELISERSNPDLPNMGLTSWSGAKVRKADVGTAKNYLDNKELDELNRIVVMYLDYAEDQAKRRKTVTMKDWRAKLDAFLEFNERDVLDDPGKVSMKVAKALAESRYEVFNKKRIELESQLDREEDLRRIEQSLEKNGEKNE